MTGDCTAAAFFHCRPRRPAPPRAVATGARTAHRSHAMKRSILVLATVCAAAALAHAEAAQPAKSKKAPDDKALVASAMQAAPAEVARDATVVVAGADGKMRTVREGHNGFTCMPDSPET